MRKDRITLIFPAQPTGNHDVAVGYAKAFRLLGHSTDIIPYHRFFKQWKEYHRFFDIINGTRSNFSQEDTMQSATLNIVLGVMQTDPDCVVIVDGTGIHKSGWEWFRRLGIKTVVIGTESPYQDKFVAHVGQIADKTFVNDFNSASRMGFESRYRCDTVFVGSGFSERVDILSGVNWDGIDLRLIGHYKIGLDHVLEPYYVDSFVSNAHAALMYNGAKISLNLNRTSVDYKGLWHIPEAVSLSPRAYEIAACGGFMISQYRPEIDSIFGDLVPTFNTSEELDALIHYWLEKDKERMEIGDELAKIVRPHSYVERAKRVLQAINEL
jgi:spore maturation protein CgeB